MSKTGKLLEILNDMGNCGLSGEMLKIYERRIDEMIASGRKMGEMARMAHMAHYVRLTRLTVSVTDEYGRPILCEVRVNADSKQTGFFTRRYMTGEDGIVTAVLPVGNVGAGVNEDVNAGVKYTVIASKGPEYSKDVQIIELTDSTTDNVANDAKEYVLKMEIKRLIDMKKMGYLCGDIHHHSIYSSPLYGGTDDVKETPEEIARSMRAAGLDFGALSDHHNVLNHERWLCTARNAKDAGADFIPIVSKEISTSNGHVIALGVDKDVIYEIPTEEMRTEDYLRGEFVRITGDIHECAGMAQLNHPTDRSRSISWNVNFNDIIEIFDTIEVWNGSNPMAENTTNGMAFKMWLRLIYGGILLPATTGSDTHNTYADDYNDMIMAIQNDETLNMVFGQALIYVKKWAMEYLSSGCVRTYINVGNVINTNNNNAKMTPGLIMEALKAGNGDSFITNGPLIYEAPCEQGRGYIIYNKNGIKELRLYYSEKNYDIIPVNSTEYVLDMGTLNMANKDYRVLYVVANAVADVSSATSAALEVAIKYIGKIKM